MNCHVDLRNYKSWCAQVNFTENSLQDDNKNLKKKKINYSNLTQT